MKIEIRPAALDDYEAIETIMEQIQALHTALRPDIYKETKTVLPVDALKAAIAQGSFFVATLDGRVVGVLSVLFRHVESHTQMTRDVLFADTLAVDEAYRKKGIGRALLNFLKKLKEENRLDGVELQVNALNEGALEFYRKCGFVPKSVNMELPQ